MNYKITTSVIILALIMLLFSAFYFGRNDPTGVWEARMLKDDNNWFVSRLDIRGNKTFVNDTWEERTVLDSAAAIATKPSRKSGTWEHSSEVFILKGDTDFIRGQAIPIHSENSEPYAQWLIENEDKRGTPEWVEVAKANAILKARKRINTKKLIFDTKFLVEIDGSLLRYTKMN